MMKAMNNLFLQDEILLLALRDQKGTILPGTMYQYALGGAILSELLLHKRIKVIEKRWSKLVEVTDPAPVGEPLIDLCFDKIKNARRRGSLQTWISRFANISKLKHQIAEKLCRMGILKEDEGKVLLFFTRKVYPEINPKPERELIRRMHHAICSDTREIDSRTVVLIALTHHAGILKGSFDKSELKSRKNRIKEIIEGNLMGEAAKEAIEAVQAAVAIAAIMPAIVASTTAASS